MTRIDFYILPDQDTDAAERFACLVSLRGLNSGLPVHIHTPSEEVAERLDALLWDYPKRRFIPHALANGDTLDTPVHIGWQPPKHTQGLLINLSQEIPAFFGRFDRVAEIVVDVEGVKEAGRERYRQYRHKGFPINNHQLNDWERASA